MVYRKADHARGNRNFESYFINGRYIKSTLIAKALEDGYRGFMMQHKYPFTVLTISLDGTLVDVNVHPNKMELRFFQWRNFVSAACSVVVDTVAGERTHSESYSS